MPTDVYIKFGDCGDKGGPLNTDLPDYEGDSSDLTHWWWCELREAGFDIEGPPLVKETDEQTGTSQMTVSKDKKGDSNPPKLKSVTLRKRVDWASPQLFQLCIYAAMNSTVPPRPLKFQDDDSDATGIVNFVTVDVCRPAGGEKVVGVQVIYSDVTITRYELSLSAPEPAESITFEYKTVSYEYNEVDPYTGVLVVGGKKKTGPKKGLEGNEYDTGSDTSETGGGSPEAEAPEGGGAGGGTPSPALASAGAVGAPTTPGAAPDPTVTVNYPGLWQGTGFGLLPD
jgi:type VI protein secretion system component Hcp